MSNRLDPITKSVVANAKEQGLVLHELNLADLQTQAQKMRAEAHAEFWRKVGRGLARLLRRRQAATAAPDATPVDTGTGCANDNRGQLAA